MELDLASNQISELSPAAFKGHHLSGPSPLGRVPLQRLILRDNLLTAVPDSALHVLTSLNYLDLSGNLVHAVDNYNFVGLENLLHLSLAGNQIASISPGALQRLPELIELDLTDNYLRSLPEDISTEMQHLLVLHLAGNYLTSCPRFTANAKLNTLNVSHNAITNCSSLHDLRYSLNDIDLSHNLLEVITANLFADVEFLRDIDLSHNRIAHVQLGAFPRELRSLKLSHNYLTAIPTLALEHLEELYLDQNQISYISEGDFYQLYALRYIELSWNKLKKLDSRVFSTGREHSMNVQDRRLSVDIHVEHNNIGEVGSDSFIMSPRGATSDNSAPVLHLYLDDNHVEKWPQMSLHSPHIKKLSLGNNHLTSYQNLQSTTTVSFLLDISNNPFNKRDLTNLNADSLAVDFTYCHLDIMPRTKFDMLKSINLSHNYITHIAGNQFISNDLTTLDLSHNKLHDPKLFTNGFTGLRADRIILSHNSITHLPNASFVNLTATSIDLSSNKVASIDTRTFINATNLKYLHLSHNDLTTFTAFCSSEMRQLEYLDLSWNNIQHIDSRALSDCARLQVLNLTSNKLIVTEFSTALALTNIDIRELYLSKNKLDRLPTRGILNKTPSLSVLDLRGNKLKSLEKNVFIVDGANNLSNMPRIILLSRNKLKSIGTALSRITYITYLDVSYNRLETLEDNSLPQHLIRTLDLSHNKLMRVPTLTNIPIINLNLSYNAIDTLDINTFSTYHMLINLDISYNKIFSVSSDSLQMLVNIRYLNISGNLPSSTWISNGTLDCLISLSCDHMDMLHLPTVRAPRLQALSLQGNRIQNITQDKLRHIGKLRWLNLRNNSITSVPLNIWRKLKYLTYLDISRNSFSELHPATLAKLSKVKVLHMDELEVGVRFTYDVFQEMWQVRELSISLNSTSILIYMPHIWYLYLDLPHYTLNEVLLRPIYDNIPQLEDLFIRASGANEVSPDIFMRFVGRWLRLSGSNISKLPRTILASTNKFPIRVDISDNLLTGIPVDVFTNMRLTSLSVRGNPVRCQCDDTSDNMAVSAPSHWAHHYSDGIGEGVRCVNPPYKLYRDYVRAYTDTCQGGGDRKDGEISGAENLQQQMSRYSLILILVYILQAVLAQQH